MGWLWNASGAEDRTDAPPGSQRRDQARIRTWNRGERCLVGRARATTHRHQSTADDGDDGSNRRNDRARVRGAGVDGKVIDHAKQKNHDPETDEGITGPAHSIPPNLSRAVSTWHSYRLPLYVPFACVPAVLPLGD